MATVAAAAQAVPKVLPAAGRFSAAGRVILYDGVCNLCNSGIRWVAKRDPDKRLMFCSVQSRAAMPYLEGAGMTRQDALKRFVFIEYLDVSTGSTAALKVTKHLQQPWPLAQSLLLVPAPVRDALYDWVAARRYRMFGRTDVCQIPDTELLDRFVDRDELLAGTCSQEGLKLPETDQLEQDGQTDGKSKKAD